MRDINPPIEVTFNPLADAEIGRTITMDGQQLLASARLDPAVAEVAARLIPDVGEDARVSICLRLWAGCVDGAKIIALETPSGPSTAAGRARAHTDVIVPRAAADPIYAAGAEAAQAFNRLSNQPTCFEGLPSDSILREPT